MASAAQIQKRDIITSSSANRGLQACAVSSTVAAAAVAAANHYSPTFRARLGVSGKVGLVAMAGLASFAIVSENDLLRGTRNPDQYIAELQNPNATNAVTQAKPKRSLPMYQRFANYVHDYPFRTLVFTATPLVGAIFLDQSRNKNIQLSQKIMHTRIYGQGTCVVLLLSTMALYDYMSRRGPFE